jgi:hypothetical protein
MIFFFCPSPYYSHLMLLMMKMIRFLNYIWLVITLKVDCLWHLSWRQERLILIHHLRRVHLNMNSLGGKSTCWNRVHLIRSSSCCSSESITDPAWVLTKSDTTAARGSAHRLILHGPIVRMRRLHSADNVQIICVATIVQLVEASEVLYNNK